MVPTSYQFPNGFRWGTATSSYQVEGHLTNNDWYRAAQLGGFIYENQAAGAACDWWNRAEEDFDRMVDLSQNAHRLSIEWSRVEPSPGTWDEHALARYREMLQALRARGIEPMVTLHHFTNPLWLSELGGWENEDVIVLFRRYVRKVFSALGDLTSLWCTINEPAVMIGQTYTLGRWWPGRTDFNAAIRAAINVVRAHASAYHLLHELQRGAQVGFAKHVMAWSPWRPWLPNDHIGAQLMERLFNLLPINMVTSGIMRIPGRRSIFMPEAANTLDWLGVNYYQRYRISLRLPDILTNKPSGWPLQQHTKPGVLAGPGGWGEIHPSGLLVSLKNLWRRYRLPMIITENGIPDRDDAHRPGFIVRHLRQLWEALRRGIPVLGYYFWSLVDNYEWTEGYDPRFRFGLIGVDFETQERRVRPSGHLYAAICKAGALTYDAVDTYAPQVASEIFPVR